MITPEPGAVIAGRYTLSHLLGRGGMGSVWRARHRDLETDVAVKLMDPAIVASAEARARFEREARVAARLRSQHVVQVHDYGVEDGTPYIILELLEGESLSARLAREGRLTPSVAARILAEICKALGTAHEAGLVHRDLKPANIFLALKDREKVVKILDFGIVKSFGHGDVSSDTATGMMLGSAHYMSPEQIRSSRHVDHRSDLWSIGIVLYRMVTGRLPFSGVDLGDVLVRVCTDVPHRPSSLVPELPAEVDRFFERALARIPIQRFQSAMDFTEAFDAVWWSRPTTSPGHAVAWRAPAAPMAESADEALRADAPSEARLPVSSGDELDIALQATSAALLPSSAADDPTIGVLAVAEVDTASIAAVLVPGERVERLPRVSPPPLLARGTVGRSFRIVAAAAATVTLVGVAGAGMLRGRTPPSAVVATTTRATVAPPSDTITPIVPPSVGSAAPEVSAPPRVRRVPIVGPRVLVVKPAAQNDKERAPSTPPVATVEHPAAPVAIPTVKSLGLMENPN